MTITQKLFQSPPPNLRFDIEPRSKRKLSVSPGAELAIATFAVKLAGKNVRRIVYTFDLESLSLTFEDEAFKIWVMSKMGGKRGNLPITELRLVATDFFAEQRYHLETEAELEAEDLVREQQEQLLRALLPGEDDSELDEVQLIQRELYGPGSRSVQ